MNKFIYCLLIPFLGACSVSRNSVYSDYSLNGNFASYTSFSIVANKGLEVEDRQVIEASIFKRLNAMGYSQKTYHPSIYITYTIFDTTFKMRTYEQKPLAQWLNTLSPNDLSSEPSIRSHYERISGETVLINFYDPVAREMVWRGYYTLHHPHQSFRELVFSINRILDDFVIKQSLAGTPMVRK